MSSDLISLKRRRALRRLGLTAAIAYSAPTILRLDRAKAGPSFCHHEDQGNHYGSSGGDQGWHGCHGGGHGGGDDGGGDGD